MIPVDQAWDNFNKNIIPDMKEAKKNKPNLISPKCSAIYISTKTKIAYLNHPNQSKLNILVYTCSSYQAREDCVIKKQMKINCLSPQDVVELEKKIRQSTNEDTYISVDILKQIKDTKKIKFKDIRKINIGLCKKDLSTFRKKKKGAFYNCFVLIIRIFFEGIYKEIHIKIFNTGKLEIPGIREDKLLIRALNILISILQPYHLQKLSYSETGIQTVLINSNFTCNYYIARDKLYSILKYKYNIHVIFDSCSYPGIQCKFYYNNNNKKNNGICYCTQKCSKKGTGDGDGQCKEISFMIFRTGSVLIVGNCCETILNIIYEFLKIIFMDEYKEIMIENSSQSNKPKKKKRLRKKNIFFSLNY